MDFEKLQAKAASVDWDLLSSYAGLLTLATLTIYAGSYASLTRLPKKASERDKDLPRVDDDDDEDEDVDERMSSSDAWMFPVIGSAVLLGLYLLVKYVGQEWINYLFGWYFAFAGVGSVWNVLIALTRSICGESRWKSFEKIRLRILKGPRELLAASCRTPSILLLPVGAIPSLLYSFLPGTRKSIILTDLLGVSFSYNALSLLKIDSFSTGTILLGGLFVYDIFWVFGTDVMVHVATSLDAPIKLMWPKSLKFSAARGFTMLGLGDIVVPGLFAALALRYDRHRALAFTSKGALETPYFHAALVAYVLGLVTTMTVMHVFGAAQPALLYLSPALIMSFVLTALVRGEIGDAWNWTDAPDEKKPPADDGKPAGGVAARPDLAAVKENGKAAE